jgi:sugar O-acyltransferase (sialic acid O-acetyltransferase NeuD family)
MTSDHHPGLGLPQQSTSPVVIVGAGGHGRVVLDILQQDRAVQVVGFIDSNADLVGRRIDGVPVLGRMQDLPNLKTQHHLAGAIVAIGTNGIRRAFAEEIEQINLDLINAVHPSANVAANATLGKNIVIAAGAQVCAHCQIGDSVILNTGSIVDHESMIGTAAHICPGARLAGRVTVEAGAFVGIGATVIQSLRIGYEAIVGAGAVVIHDVEPMATVVGVPARVAHDLAGHEDFAEWLMPEYLREAKPNRRPPTPKPNAPGPAQHLKGR